MEQQSGSHYCKEGGADGIKKRFYFIFNGGYDTWPRLIAPYKHQLHDSAESIQSEHRELTRQDVECFFGISKKRFLILKNPIFLRKIKQVTNFVISCSCIQYILLSYDGYDDWKELICNHIVEDADYGVNDEDGLPIGTNKGGSKRFTSRQHQMTQALANNNAEFAGNDFDVDNAEDTIDAPTAGEKKARINSRRVKFDRSSLQTVVWS